MRHTTAISPTKASRCCRNVEVGADAEPEDLNGVRGGGWLLEDIVTV